MFYRMLLENKIFIPSIINNKSMNKIGFKLRNMLELTLIYFSLLSDVIESVRNATRIV